MLAWLLERLSFAISGNGANEPLSSRAAKL